MAVIKKTKKRCDKRNKKGVKKAKYVSDKKTKKRMQ